jgi:lipopolysaccharide transport system permease protein
MYGAFDAVHQHMSSFMASPRRISSEIWQHRYLLGQLIRRDVLLRYRGAMFGVLWVFLSPLCMMAIFAFVFGQIFQARWPQQTDAIPSWLVLYAGLITFNLFADTVSRAPASVRSYPSYVKKIIFPVQILPLVPLGAGLIHGVFNLLILVAALAWTQHLHLNLLLFPFLLVPAILLGMGLSWFLAAWGVFIKDMTQIVPLFLQMLLFLSPVFYPSTAVPAALQWLFKLNPLGVVIEATRAAMLGQSVPLAAWTVALVLGTMTAVLGFSFFKYACDEFADAL